MGTMTPLGRARDHYWRALTMAKAVGVDMARAQVQSDLDPVQWAETIERCRGCAWIGGCDHWLARHELDAEPVDKPPERCPNAALFAALKRAQETP